jgi:hypothetical protein
VSVCDTFLVSLLLGSGGALTQLLWRAREASDETYAAWFRALEQDRCFLVLMQLLRRVAEELLDSVFACNRGPAVGVWHVFWPSRLHRLCGSHCAS